MRLDKALTLTGLTRSQARKAIADGRARVLGVPVRDAAANVEAEAVTLDGAPIAFTGELTLMLHKPAGVLTATEDRKLPTVLDFVPEQWKNRGLGPVGRLDRDVTGLVLLTTDGRLAHRLISPKRRVEKIYEAQVEGVPTEAELDQIRAGGLVFSDFTSSPAGAEWLGDRLRLTLTEGKFHEVKRICAKIGHEVVRLRRLSIGGVALDETLKEGQLRPLTEEESARLYEIAGMQND